MENNIVDGVRKEKMQTEPLLHDSRYVIGLSVLILVITLVIFWWFTRHRHSRNAILLLGLSDAGKTLIFLRLVYSQYRQTYTSMKENVEIYISPKGTSKIIDLPGQERLRYKCFDEHKGNAKAIVYVLDSLTIQKEIKDVADFLYNILSDKVLYKNAPPVIIVCNKQDQPLAKGEQVIQTLLEKEMNLVRVTKSSQLQSVDPNTSNAVTYLGKQNKDFEFSHLSNRVEFVECSVYSKDPNDSVQIESLQALIDKL